MAKAQAGRRAHAPGVGGERPIARSSGRLTPGKTEGVDSQCQQILAYPFRMDKVIQAFHGWLTSSILRRRLLTIGGHGLANKSSGYVRKALRMVRTIVGQWKPTGWQDTRSGVLDVIELPFLKDEQRTGRDQLAWIAPPAPCFLQRGTGAGAHIQQQSAHVGGVPALFEVVAGHPVQGKERRRTDRRPSARSSPRSLRKSKRCANSAYARQVRATSSLGPPSYWRPAEHISSGQV